MLKIPSMPLPYPAEFLKLEGLPWSGQIHCGHNPWLLARLVDDLEIVRDENGHEKATWKIRYDPRDIRAKIIALKGKRLTNTPVRGGVSVLK